MLLNVHVSPGVIAQTSKSQALYAAPALRREIQELLLRHGVLRFSSAAEARNWLDALKLADLTPREAKEWQQLLLALNKQGRLHAANPALVEDTEAVTQPSDLLPLESVAPLVSILAGPVYSRLFPAAESGVSKLSPQIEVTVPGSVSDSGLYADVLRLADSGSFAKGTKREQVWRQLFGPLANVSKHVTVFDKYLFAQLAQTSDEHVNWLLGKLDADMPSGAAVTLIGARGIGGERGELRVPRHAGEAEDMLRAYLPAAFRNISSVRIVLAPSTRQRDMHHDRHIRFSAGPAVELPSGFDRLGYLELRDNFGFTYRHSATSLSELNAREDAVTRLRDTASFELG